MTRLLCYYSPQITARASCSHCVKQNCCGSLPDFLQQSIQIINLAWLQVFRWICVKIITFWFFLTGCFLDRMWVYLKYCQALKWNLRKQKQVIKTGKNEENQWKKVWNWVCRSSRSSSTCGEEKGQKWQITAFLFSLRGLHHLNILHHFLIKLTSCVLVLLNTTYLWKTVKGKGKIKIEGWIKRK